MAGREERSSPPDVYNRLGCIEPARTCDVVLLLLLLLLWDSGNRCATIRLLFHSDWGYLYITHIIEYMQLDPLCCFCALACCFIMFYAVYHQHQQQRGMVLGSWRWIVKIWSLLRGVILLDLLIGLVGGRVSLLACLGVCVRVLWPHLVWNATLPLSAGRYTGGRRRSNRGWSLIHRRKNVDTGFFFFFLQLPPAELAVYRIFIMCVARRSMIAQTYHTYYMAPR